MKDIVEISEHVTERQVNCRGCWTLGMCTVKFKYEVRSGVHKMISAEVLKIPDGWETRPYGKSGGKAHYCPNC